MNKSVFAPGKELIVPESILVEYGLCEGQRISAEQAAQVVRAIGQLAVAKPKPSYENSAGSPH